MVDPDMRLMQVKRTTSIVYMCTELLHDRLRRVHERHLLTWRNNRDHSSRSDTIAESRRYPIKGALALLIQVHAGRFGVNCSPRPLHVIMPLLFATRMYKATELETCRLAFPIPPEFATLPVIGNHFISILYYQGIISRFIRAHNTVARNFSI